MYIVHVIPIARNVGKESLSYFTFKDIPTGSIVNVPLRKSEVPALVLRKEDAGAIKALLRTQQYSTKNIKDPKPRELLSSEFVEAAREVADYFAITVGNVLNSFVPTALLKDNNTKHAKALVSANLANSHEVLTIQSTKEERLSSYKTILRGSLARGESAFLLAPTMQEAEKFKELYKKGIENYVFLLHSGLSLKQQREAWHGALAQKHAVLIIATKGFLSIPRADLGVFVIDGEGSEVYREVMRPFVDARILAEKLARRLGARLILGDTLLTASTHKKLAENDAAEFEMATKRLRAGGRVLPIDMSKYTRDAKEEKKQYPILSLETEDAVKSTSDHMFILASRRGVASQSVCEDCGTLVLCSRCTVPMTLHGGGAEKSFLCHTCGEVKGAKTVCTHCGGWRLKALGVGIERVEEAVKALTKLPVLRIDSDSTKTPKKVRETLAEFYEAKSAILLGTTMALPHLHTSVQTSVIASLDALLAVPNFAAEEQTFRTILTLREMTKDTVLVQTRNPNNAMLKHATSGAIASFIESELALRKKFKYPPYATFIKISVVGSKEYVIREMKKLVKLLDGYEPRVFRGFVPMYAGKFALNVLVRFTGKWPDDKLVTLLHSLPPSFVVQIT